jgi:hypothetical protein
VGGGGGGGPIRATVASTAGRDRGGVIADNRGPRVSIPGRAGGGHAGDLARDQPRRGGDAHRRGEEYIIYITRVGRERGDDDRSSAISRITG